MVRYECLECNKNLHGHPKIKVEGDIYCYSCAKKVIEVLDHSTEVKHAKEIKAHDVQYEKWKNWDKKHYPANLVTLCYHCHVKEIWFGHRHKMRKPFTGA
jgi:hypothetical protein